MKVLHLIDSLGYGGAERLVVDLVPRLKARGADPVVVSVFSDMPLEKHLRGTQVPTYSLAFEGSIYNIKGLSRAASQLREVILREGISIVHSHLYTSDLLSRLAAPSFCKLISTLHGRDQWWHQRRRVRSLSKTWLDAFLRRFRQSRTICVSGDVEQEARRVLGIDPAATRVIYNGIDFTRFPRKGGAAGEKKIIIQVGRLIPVKDHVTSLLGFARLIEDRHDLQLVLIGGGPNERELRRETKRLGIEHSVVFLGLRDDVPEQLSKADIFWMPSKMEGLPIACIEAMACELPVVASRVGGIPEIVVHGQTGVLIDAGSPSQLAEATSKLLRNRDLSNRLGANGRARVEKYFSIDATADQYFRAYSDILYGKW
jgi:glycosyltransferase involved in cell wall biosynthesis